MPLFVAAWNIQTLYDRKESDQLEQHTAFITQTLAQFGIDIAALSETIF